MSTLNDCVFESLLGLGDVVPELVYENMVVLDCGVDSDLDDDIAHSVGCVVAAASMGGLGEASIKEGVLSVSIPKDPALATLGCQLAGWHITMREGFGFVSGPGRLCARKPRELMERLGFSEDSERVAAVLEADSLPDRESLEKILEKCGGLNLTLAAFRGSSKAGIINILARVVETAFFRLDLLGFDTREVASAAGSVTFPGFDVSPEEAVDLIRFGGKVEIAGACVDEDIQKKCITAGTEVADERYAEAFSKADGDFHKISPEFFSVAGLSVG